MFYEARKNVIREMYYDNHDGDENALKNAEMKQNALF